MGNIQPEFSVVDDLYEIQAMVDLLHMATVGMMEEDDRRVFGIATMQVLNMVKGLVAKVDSARRTTTS